MNYSKCISIAIVLRLILSSEWLHSVKKISQITLATEQSGEKYGFRCTKRRASIPTLCIATASAAKFAEVLEKSGLPDCKSEKIEKLRNLKSR